jgi:hypothetical protein
LVKLQFAIDADVVFAVLLPYWCALSSNATNAGAKPVIQLLMSMPAVSIWKMRMVVSQGLVSVPMTIPGAQRCGIIVLVLVMFVMDVVMIVLHLSMIMHMLVVLCQVQPRAERHQGPGIK